MAKRLGHVEMKKPEHLSKMLVVLLLVGSVVGLMSRSGLFSDSADRESATAAGAPDMTALGLGLALNPLEVRASPIGEPVPEFALPPVEGRKLGLASDDLEGEVALVNVFASWCAACRDEHSLLMALAEEGVVPVHGLNYKDKPAQAKHWLDTLGDPYERTGADLNGRVGNKWGVYGLPETYLVDQDGKSSGPRQTAP